MKLPQLSLRDLFWLVLVVGMGCAWWVDRSGLRAEYDQEYGERIEWLISAGEKWRSEREELEARIEQLEGP